jgi:hypothetical protein
MYFEAVFQPSNDTEYNSDAAGFVGKKVATREGWILEEGPHKGQQCFYTAFHNNVPSHRPPGLKTPNDGIAAVKPEKNIAK